jgi:hypothetical protein
MCTKDVLHEKNKKRRGGEERGMMLEMSSSPLYSDLKETNFINLKDREDNFFFSSLYKIL